MTRLHYRPPDGYVGDVHPFFHDGTWYLFYLKPPREPARNGIQGMVSALATSTDLLTWTEVPVVHRAEPGSANFPPVKDALSATWWLVSVVQNRETKRFHSFYGRGPGIYTSVSESLNPWKPLEINPVLPARTDRYREWRDPFVFWNEQASEYWMLLTSSLRGEPENQGGAISYARSKNLLDWQFAGTLFHPGDVGSPECPELFSLGRHWYLIASFHTGRAVGKTSYRFSRNGPTGPWLAATPDSLDGESLCAGNTAWDGTRRLLLGWVPTYGGPEEARGQQWGGDLALPREVYPLPDGSLGTRLPADLSRRLRGPLVFPSPSRPVPETVAGRWRLQNEEAACETPAGEIRLPGTFERVDFETSVTIAGHEAASAGIKLGPANGAPGFRIVLDRIGQQLLVQRDRPGGAVFSRLPVFLEPGRLARLRVLADGGDIVEVFVNDRYSLATRLPEALGTTQIHLFTQSGAATFSRSRAYELRP